MAANPQQVADDTNQIINAWTTLAASASFGGMTLAQYKAKVQPSFDARQQVASLEAQRTAALDVRDKADAVTAAANQKAVAGVRGDPAYGDDCELYEAMGYVRKSERKSGLTRGKQTPPASAGK